MGDRNHQIRTQGWPQFWVDLTTGRKAVEAQDFPPFESDDGERRLTGIHASRYYKTVSDSTTREQRITLHRYRQSTVRHETHAGSVKWPGACSTPLDRRWKPLASQPEDFHIKTSIYQTENALPAINAHMIERLCNHTWSAEWKIAPSTMEPANSAEL